MFSEELGEIDRAMQALCNVADNLPAARGQIAKKVAVSQTLSGVEARLDRLKSRSMVSTVLCYINVKMRTTMSMTLRF